MSSIQVRQVDVLRPSAEAAGAGWALRVQAAREQIERLREVDEPADFYKPMAQRFGQDPRRTDDPALDVLRSLADAGETWLDIGSGGGRYALPLALRVGQVHAVDPSPSMLDVLRAGMTEHGIGNIEVSEGYWPDAGGDVRADVVLMAHIGYAVESFAGFLDAAEAAATRRCVLVMRSSASARASQILWPEIHGQDRVAYPMLQEALVLLMARGAVPEVTLVDRGAWGDATRESLFASARRMLWLRPGSDKDRKLKALIDERATEREGKWEVDWSPMLDGVVTWEPTR